MGETPNYEPDLADRIDHRAAALGITAEEYAYDLLLEQEGRAILYQPGANYRDGNLDAVHQMLSHSGTIVGLADRSEEHTSELQSLMRISYAVFCLKKKKQTIQQTHTMHTH